MILRTVRIIRDIVRQGSTYPDNLFQPYLAVNPRRTTPRPTDLVVHDFGILLGPSPSTVTLESIGAVWIQNESTANHFESSM